MLADELPFLDELLGTPVQVREPVSDDLRVDSGHLGAGINDLGNTVGGRLRHTGGTLGRKDQHALLGGERVEAVLGTVLGVIQTGDRGLVPGSHDVAQDLEPRLHLVETPPQEVVVVRVKGEELDRHLGDVGEGALVADQDVADVGAAGSTGHVLDAHDLARRQDRLETHHHVLDAAVERRELADRTSGDETAVHGDRLRLR